MRVLVVEDQAELADDIADGLRDQGIGADVAYDGATGIEKALMNPYDVVVLDRDLPKVHGDAVCATRVGSPSTARILMLTAAATVGDRVQGLNLGADDYLGKPFAFSELVARVRANLRPRAGAPDTLLRAGGICIDVVRREVTFGGREVCLSSREFFLLKEFVTHPRQILSRPELLHAVWGTTFDPGTNVVDVYVGYLRRKLGERVIETVRGAGYRLRIDGPAGTTK